MKAKVFSRDDALRFILEKKNKLIEEHKDDQDSTLLIEGVVLLESIYGSLERFPCIEIEEDD